MTDRRMRWQTPEARELAASLNLVDPEEAMRRHARALAAEQGDCSVPVRLAAFFMWAGVRKVKVEEMPLEGALRRLPDERFDIVVRADRAPTRQRFSIAHELGHVLFHRHAPKAKAKQIAGRKSAPVEEERLCNIAAEELLMPAAIVEQALGAAEGARRVLYLARECEVSIEAAMVRLSACWREPGELQLWEFRNQWSLKLVSRVGPGRLSLSTFAVDEWNGQKTPDASALRTPWKGATTLYSKERRERLAARTTVVPISRRVPTLLISHALVRDSTTPPITDLERAARARARAAAIATARTDCTDCGGKGWIYPEAYDPAMRLKPVPMCSCRFGSAHVG